jgi:hypothetical protein
VITLLGGVVAVALVWWLLKSYTSANPAKLAGMLRKIGGGVLLASGALLAFRGRIDLGLLVAGAGTWLLGWRNFIPPFLEPGSAPTGGATSRVRSLTIEMTLDHDSGTLKGSVLAGAFAGRDLDTLDRAQIEEVLRTCAAGDPDGLRLLEPYMDRRFPGWSEATDSYAYARRGESPRAGDMTEKEAYEILGLQPGAGEDDIRQSHRTLMKKLHPDQGGSTYLATRVNQAKDVLLARRR